jgi:hypothetical protein
MSSYRWAIVWRGSGPRNLGGSLEAYGFSSLSDALKDAREHALAFVTERSDYQVLGSTIRVIVRKGTLGNSPIVRDCMSSWGNFIGKEALVDYISTKEIGLAEAKVLFKLDSEGK